MSVKKKTRAKSIYSYGSSKEITNKYVLPTTSDVMRYVLFYPIYDFSTNLRELQ